MAQLIDDLLGLSRVTRAEFERSPVDLSAIARAILDRLQATDRDRRATINIAEGVVAMGDARLLRVALDNLLGNAWKFTSKRQVAHIEFGALSGVYFVRDDGAGFDMA
jgi:signal transduction histidine kinase